MPLIVVVGLDIIHLSLFDIYLSVKIKLNMFLQRHKTFIIKLIYYSKRQKGSRKTIVLH